MMNKLLNKTIGKIRILAMLTALVALLGIVVVAVFGFNADATLENNKTLTVKFEAYRTDSRVEEAIDVCEGVFNSNGVDYKYVVKGKDSANTELEFVFDCSTKAEKLETVKAAVETKLGEKFNQDFPAQVSVNEVVASYPAGYAWRGAVAAVVVLVLEFAYVAIRFNVPMGGAAAASSAAAGLVSFALIAFVRIPVTQSVIYLPAFAMLAACAMSVVALSAIRTKSKTEEFKSADLKDAIVAAMPVKQLSVFALGLCVAFALAAVVNFVVSNVAWFMLGAVIATISAAYASILLLPATYLPVKKSVDAKAAAKARYDYKPEK